MSFKLHPIVRFWIKQDREPTPPYRLIHHLSFDLIIIGIVPTHTPPKRQRSNSLDLENFQANEIMHWNQLAQVCPKAFYVANYSRRYMQCWHVVYGIIDDDVLFTVATAAYDWATNTQELYVIPEICEIPI